MRYSQIQTINDFNAYLQECKVIAKPHCCRIGKENESHHSVQSLKNKLQQLILSEPFFPGVEIHETLEGRVLIAAGMSNQDKIEVMRAVNRLIVSVGLLTALEREAHDSKPKGFFTKIDRLFTRIALHRRYGSQPKGSKLLDRVRELITQRMNEEIIHTQKGVALPLEARDIICESITKLRDELFSALTANHIIDLSFESSSDEYSTSESEPDTISMNDLSIEKEIPASPKKLSTERRILSFMLKGKTLRPVSIDGRSKSQHRSSFQKSLLSTLDHRRDRIKYSSPLPSPTCDNNWLDEN